MPTRQFLQPRGALPPASQGLPLAAEPRGTCALTAPLPSKETSPTSRSTLGPTERTQIPKKLAHSQTGTHLRASLQAFGLFFIV